MTSECKGKPLCMPKDWNAVRAAAKWLGVKEKCTSRKGSTRHDLPIFECSFNMPKKHVQDSFARITSMSMARTRTGDCGLSPDKQSKYYFTLHLKGRYRGIVCRFEQNRTEEYACYANCKPSTFRETYVRCERDKKPIDYKTYQAILKHLDATYVQSIFGASILRSLGEAMVEILKRLVGS